MWQTKHKAGLIETQQILRPRISSTNGIRTAMHIPNTKLREKLKARSRTFTTSQNNPSLWWNGKWRILNKRTGSSQKTDVIERKVFPPLVRKWLFSLPPLRGSRGLHLLQDIFRQWLSRGTLHKQNSSREQRSKVQQTQQLKIKVCLSSLFYFSLIDSIVCHVG